MKRLAILSLLAAAASPVFAAGTNHPNNGISDDQTGPSPHPWCMYMPGRPTFSPCWAWDNANGKGNGIL
jgi:hypothetical protein